MKNLIFLFSNLVFIGLSSCSYPNYRLQHEQPDDVYWKSSDSQQKEKSLDDVKFEQAPSTPPQKQPSKPRQPKQLQESSLQEEAVGVEPNDEARAEAAYQAWNQQRLSNNQNSTANSQTNTIQELQPATAPQNSQPFTVNNYNNNYFSNNRSFRTGLRYNSRWLNPSMNDFYFGNSYFGWNDFSGWQFGYQWPVFNSMWGAPLWHQPFGNYWGFNPFFNNFGFYNQFYSPWCNPFYPNYFGYANPWIGYYSPWFRTHERNLNPSRSRPRESIGSSGQDHSNPNGGMLNPGTRPFLGKKESDEATVSGQGKMRNPGMALPKQQAAPAVSVPIEAKPNTNPGLPMQQPADNTQPSVNGIPPVNNPVYADPSNYRDKSFRGEESLQDGGKLINGSNGPIYVPPRDNVSQTMPERSTQPNRIQGIGNQEMQPNRGYIPDRNQSIQQIQSPAPRNEFPSRVHERIEYQAPASSPQRNGGGFNGFSNGSGGGGSNSSGNRSGGSISRPR